MVKLRVGNCNKFTLHPLFYILTQLNQPYTMKNPMYYDTHRTKICKEIYKPSPNLFRFIKSIWAVFMIGESPISKSAYSRRRIH
jgi:hypothetical protein